jgi:hypothetical protein
MQRDGDEEAFCDFLCLPLTLRPANGSCPQGLRNAVDRLQFVADEPTPAGKARVLIQTRQFVRQAVLAARLREGVLVCNAGRLLVEISSFIQRPMQRCLTWLAVILP